MSKVTYKGFREVFTLANGLNLLNQGKTKQEHKLNVVSSME